MIRNIISLLHIMLVCVWSVQIAIVTLREVNWHQLIPWIRQRYLIYFDSKRLH